MLREVGNSKKISKSGSGGLILQTSGITKYIIHKQNRNLYLSMAWTHKIVILQIIVEYPIA